MGLIKAATSAVGGVLGDSWKEAMHCERMDNTVILRRGTRMNAGTGSNAKGNANIINKGSIINVEEMTCMLTLDNGRITNIVTEPGQYVFDNSTAPSVWAGDIAASLKDALMRFTFGGLASTEQKVVYINLQRLPGIKFGTGSEVPYPDPRYNTTLNLRYYGTFEIQIPDAEMAVRFYREVGSKGVGAGDITVAEVFGSDQYKMEFMGFMETAMNYMAGDGVCYNELARSKEKLTQYAKDATRDNWLTRGFMLTSVALGPVSITKESEDLLSERRQADTMLGGDVQRAMIARGLAHGIESAGKNEGGAMMGFMGLNMAQQAGGNILGQMGPANDAFNQNQSGYQQPQQRPQGGGTGANTWKCACGADNAGKFCSQCGAAKPESPAGWTCSCGKVNTGKFCAECGKPAPAASAEWTCTCGAKNTGKFCSNCGGAKV